jgi:aminoglycoside phosphotransferase (APT) family kinase protein
VIDDVLVRGLLREQHPDLADGSLRLAATGWDHQLWRLGDELAVRLPCTERAPELLRKEHRWVPTLAPRLPLPVPVPLRIGEPSARFPKPWTVTTWVPGDPADRVPISDGHRAAGALAAFLRALHLEAPADAPADGFRGVPLGTLAHELEARIRAVEDGGGLDGLRGVWDDAVAAPVWRGPPLWIHGDLHPANVLVRGGTLAGVVDFGEVCAGDPATDLAAAWLLLPEGAAARFFAAYANADDAAVRRARGWAVIFGLSLVAIGRAWERGLPGGKRTWAPAGWGALGRVLGSVTGPGS